MQMGGVGGVGGFNLGLGSPGPGGMLGGLNMAQLAQLDVGGMDPFNMNMLGMANRDGHIARGTAPRASDCAGGGWPRL